MPAACLRPAMPSDSHQREATEVWFWAGTHREEGWVGSACPELLHRVRSCPWMMLPGDTLRAVAKRRERMSP